VFLGHVISKKGIYVDPKKVEVILKWKHFTKMIEIQSFLGLVGYYQRFIEGFSKIASSIT